MKMFPIRRLLPNVPLYFALMQLLTLVLININLNNIFNYIIELQVYVLVRIRHNVQKSACK